MANIFLSQDINYISIQEVKDSTMKPELALLNNDKIKQLIVVAEKIIDDWVWYALDVEEAEDDMIQDRKIATLFTVEQLFENGDNIAKQTDPVRSERTGDRMVEYATDKKISVLGIPQNALDILKGYRHNFYRQVI